MGIYIYTWKMFDYGESRSGEYLLFYFKLLLNKNQVVGFVHKLNTIVKSHAISNNILITIQIRTNGRKASSHISL
jgi:hypothetical protein